MVDSVKRLQFIDAIKGIAVLFIVIYHILAPCAFREVVCQLMDVFLIAFFFYSGYFTGRESGALRRT